MKLATKVNVADVIREAQEGVQKAQRAAIQKLEAQVNGLRDEIGQAEKALEKALKAKRDQLSRLEDAITDLRGGGRRQRTSVAGTRAPRGANKAKIITFLDQHPGSTPTQVSEGTGITYGVAYGAIKNAVKSGEVVKNGNGYRTS
jgi:TolA-binding protein